MSDIEVNIINDISLITNLPRQYFINELEKIKEEIKTLKRKYWLRIFIGKLNRFLK